MVTKVTHLTTVHSRYDTRIFLKECRALASSGFEVSLVVADGNGDEVKERVAIYDVGLARGRLSRMIYAARKVHDKAKELNSDIYHMHDPELIPVGIKLKKIGKVVVFDAHEDVPRQILSKNYLPIYTRNFLSKVFSSYEAWACHKLDAVATATPAIRDKFKALGNVAVDINNFPMLGELSEDEIDWKKKECKIAYIGGIARIRGIIEVVKALSKLSCGARLQLGGNLSDVDLEEIVKAESGWQRVDAFGFINRQQVREVLSHAIAGLVTFHSAPNHMDAQPNKMFEYMSAGLPVIASNFPLWKEIIEGNQCGICVDPLDPQAIADAIDYLVTNPEVAEQMGRNGQRVVRERYNWQNEEKKLVQLYHQLLS